MPELAISLLAYQSMAPTGYPDAGTAAHNPSASGPANWPVALGSV